MKDFFNLVDKLIQSNNYTTLIIMCLIFALYIFWKSGLIETIKKFFSNEDLDEKIENVNTNVKNSTKETRENMVELSTLPIKEIDNKIVILKNYMEKLHNEIEDIKDISTENNIESHRKYEEIIKAINDINVKLAIINTIVTNINSQPYKSPWGDNPK